MDSGPTSVSTAYVEHFLEREREDARRWLRREMDSLVDSLFGQMRSKFVQSLAVSASSGHHHGYHGSSPHGYHTIGSHQPTSFSYSPQNQHYANSEVQLIGPSVPNTHFPSPQIPSSPNYPAAQNHQYPHSSYPPQTPTHHVPIPLSRIKQEITDDVLELGPIVRTSQFYSQSQSQHVTPHSTRSSCSSTRSSATTPVSLDSFESLRFGTNHNQSIPSPRVSTVPTHAPLFQNIQQKSPLVLNESHSHAANTTEIFSESVESSINNIGPFSQESHHSSSSRTVESCSRSSFHMDQQSESNSIQNFDDLKGSTLGTSTKNEPESQESQISMISCEPDPIHHHDDDEPDDPNEPQLPFDETMEEEVERQQGILITQSLKCLQEVCDRQFESKYDLNRHMYEEHGVMSNRCQMRGCQQSFGNNLDLNEHLRVAHPQTSEFFCPRCPKSYKKYIFLYSHMLMSHQEGRFKCAFKDCSFVAEYRRHVYIHYNQHQAFACPFPTCKKTFTQKVNLRAHERTHLKIKPYRCKWPKCRYATERYSSAVNHIRGKHFNLPPTKKEQKERNIVDTRDPKDFLMIVSELLNC